MPKDMLDKINQTKIMNKKQCQECGHRLYWRATAKAHICKNWKCKNYWKYGDISGTSNFKIIKKGKRNKYKLNLNSLFGKN